MEIETETDTEVETKAEAKTEAQIAEDQKANYDMAQEIADKQNQFNQEYEHRRELRSC